MLKQISTVFSLSTIYNIYVYTVYRFVRINKWTEHTHPATHSSNCLTTVNLLAFFFFFFFKSDKATENNVFAVPNKHKQVGKLFFRGRGFIA